MLRKCVFKIFAFVSGSVFGELLKTGFGVCGEQGCVEGGQGRPGPAGSLPLTVRPSTYPLPNSLAACEMSLFSNGMHLFFFSEPKSYLIQALSSALTR